MTWFFFVTTRRQERALYTQHPYHCGLDWGRRGVRQAAERGDLLVIVDTLSFSTAVVTAVHSGGLIYPCSLEQDAAVVVSKLLAQEDLAVTVIACGERWNPPSEDGGLRIAVEDYLGSGAILSSLHFEKSSEARVCEGAFV